MPGDARLPHQQSNRGSAAGVPAPPQPQPSTPRKDGSTLNALIHALENEWHLGLATRDELWSPSKSNNALADKVHGQLKRLHYSSGFGLERALQSFRQIAAGFEQHERLKLLHGVLRSQAPGSRERVGTRTDELRGLGDGASRTGMVELISATQQAQRITPCSGALRLHRQIRLDTSYANAFEPGSPTDVDEEEYFTPPSPSLSSRAAQRRVKSVNYFQSGFTMKKRPSDSSAESGTSPKLTRTLKGKRAAIQPLKAGVEMPATSPSLFKQPSLDMARSFQMVSTPSTANTSFDSMSESQQAQPDTAMTSFKSNGDDGDVVYPDLNRSSSPIIGSLNDQDLLDITAKLERELSQSPRRLSRSSQLAGDFSSTFGSIDEDAPVTTSFATGEEHRMPPAFSALRSPTTPTRRVLHSVSPAQVTPPNKRKLNAQQPGAISPAVSHQLHPQASANGSSLLPMASNTGATLVLDAKTSSAKGSSTIDSPSRLPYQIREIPEQNLFSDDVPKELTGFPYFTRFIGCRIAKDNGMSMLELMSGLDQSRVQSDSTAFWNAIDKHPKVSIMPIREPRKVWSAAKKDFIGYTFKGQVLFNKSGPVFSLSLLPIEADLSCRFQRKFGSDRFLYLTFPSLEANGKGKPTRFTGDQMKQIQSYWKDWFQREHEFLGRRWRAFHLRPIKRKDGRSKDDCDGKRVVLFATEGIDIDRPLSIGQLLNWFFPFARNTHQTFCKAYSRLDLGLSRTTPTVDFKPSQIRYITDALADGSPESTQFNDQDPTIVWNEQCERELVMNDGCSLMSVGAALQIWKQYCKVTQSSDPMPSVFQGRIGGAKGVWMISKKLTTRDPADLEVWIEITPSQLKFDPIEDDLYDNRAYDPLRLTFEHCNHSRSPVLSELHISFIPIIVDRGVPQHVIADMITTRLDDERDGLVDMLSDPGKLDHWIHQERSTTSGPDTSRFQADFPHTLPEKIQLMLRSGFYPEHEPYLATILCRVIKQRQIWMEKKLKIPLEKAAFLIGVADPLGILAPGEVHVDFSSPFLDPLTNRKVSYDLDNVEVLVARQPACRRSDMQKVHAVRRPELSHLRDVVVFPSRGEYPLAGKLQGGDYDGDIFWLCWEPTLVEPFKNAPAPLKAIQPTAYNVQRDTRKLLDVMTPTDLSTVDKLLQEVLDFCLAPSLLGKVTNFLIKQAYRENQIHSERLQQLCDVHDLLVDAPKQGYLFSQKDYDQLIQTRLRCGNPKVPAYKQAMEDCESAKLGEDDKVRTKDYKHRKENVLDYLYFDIVRKHDVATYTSVKDALPKEMSDDPALQYPYHYCRDNGSDIVKKELATLVGSLKDLVWKWNQMSYGKGISGSSTYNQTVNDCYRVYSSLMPHNVDHPDIQRLLYSYLGPSFSVWEYIRASALYITRPKKQGLVWHMAGKKLAFLKATNEPGSTTIVARILENMKPKPIKKAKAEEDESSEDEGLDAIEQIYA